MWRWIMAAWAVGAAIGCSAAAKVTQPVAEAAGEALLSDRQLSDLGQKMSAQVKAEMEVLRDPQVQQYVDDVARRVLSTVPEDERRFDYQFTVLAEPKTVNAFALPGGHIFVTTGLLQAMETEAQLAAVLGHEIAHVTKGHVEEKIAAQYGFQALQQLALGKDPHMLAQLASTIAGRGYLAAYSREEEQEADATGLTYLVKAGYSPSAMVRFMEGLAKRSDEPPALIQFFASHPAPAERAQTLRSLIEERGYPPAQQSIIGGFQQIQAQVERGPAAG